MSGNMADLLAQLPALLGGHLVLSVAALGTGIALSLPLGMAASRSRRLGGAVLGVAGVIQTVPGLALLALMVAALGGTIGFLPAYLALALYSVLPVLRNTVAGIAGVDPAVIDAANGAGMTSRQRLFRVELPLAAPIIIAGIRTSTVWVVGTATLSTPVGAASLGNYIFAGLQTRNTASVIFGCVFAALLAVVLDQLVRAAETAAQRRDKARGMLAAAGLVLIVGGGLMPLALKSGGPTGTREDAPLAGTHITVGAKTFTEQYVLARLLKQRLEDAGARVTLTESLGSTILFDALSAGTVDVYVDYTGTLWTTILKRDAPAERNQMLADVKNHLQKRHGIRVIGRLGFENAYAFAMRRDRARQLGIRSIADIGRQAGLTLGGDPEFFARPEWTRVRDSYGLDRLAARGMDSTFMYGAVRDGEVDVITAYTTDARIDAFNLVLLDDPKAAFPPYDAVLLVSPGAYQTPGLVAALTPLLDRISTPLMRQANGRVDRGDETPGQAANFLEDVLTAHPQPVP